MDCSLPCSSLHGIFQARVLEQVATSFSRGSSQPRDRTWVSHIVGRRFTVWATREVSALVLYILFISLCLPSPGNHWSFYCPHCFAFSRMSCSWNHKICSLMVFFQSFFHIYSWLDSSFIFFSVLNNIQLSECTTVYPFTYWRTSWLHPDFGNYEWSGHKHPCADFCVDIVFSYFQYRVCNWFCKKLPNCILKWLCFAFPPAKDENSCCSTSSPTFGAVSVLNFGYSVRCIVMSHCFNLYCPIDIWSGTPFHILICYLYVFFGEVFLQILCPFLIGLFIFSLLSFKSSLCILDNSPLSDMSFANIYCQSLANLFIIYLS